MSERLREAARPFADYYARQRKAYGERGGVLDRYPDSHPFRDIGASELRLGLWRELHVALDAEPDEVARQAIAETIAERPESFSQAAKDAAQPSPTNEERAQKIYKQGSDAAHAELADKRREGSAYAYAPGVLRRAMVPAIAAALAAAEARGLERAKPLIQAAEDALDCCGCDYPVCSGGGCFGCAKQGEGKRAKANLAAAIRALKEPRK